MIIQQKQDQVYSFIIDHIDEYTDQDDTVDVDSLASFTAECMDVADDQELHQFILDAIDSYLD